MAKKIKAIEYLGGICKKCKIDNFHVLSFHHVDPDNKEDSVSRLIGDCRWSRIQRELEKCELLCRNCHSEIHNGEKEVKRYLLDLYGDNKCGRCGYKKSISALEFHHTDPKVKDIKFGRINNMYISDSRLGKIVREMKKCVILCSNCHFVSHIDMKLFKDNEIRIYEKVKGYVEVPRKQIDRSVVYSMYQGGNRVIDIAEFFKCNKGTISKILTKGREEGFISHPENTNWDHRK